MPPPPRALPRSSRALAPALAVGGLGLVVQRSALFPLLYLVLPALLIWALALSLHAGHSKHRRHAGA